ncbi:hypothetical protein K1719_033312 [Acacia pycnantha]|nr:hypothetical protein K1719_033312 [Acacia pycnantha]
MKSLRSDRCTYVFASFFHGEGEWRSLAVRVKAASDYEEGRRATMKTDEGVETSGSEFEEGAPVIRSFSTAKSSKR